MKRDSPYVQQLRFRILSQSLRPFASELSAPLCVRALLLYTRAAADAMTSLGHPDRFQSEAALNLARGLLGWCAPGLTGRVHTGAVPLSNLATGEFVNDANAYCLPSQARRDPRDVIRVERLVLGGMAVFAVATTAFLIRRRKKSRRRPG